MKNVLITGGTGFLGSHIAKRILPKVDTLTIVTLNIKQKTSLKNLGIDTKKINLVEGDIRDNNFIKLLFNEYDFARAQKLHIIFGNEYNCAPLFL